MKLAVLKERQPNEARVSVSPDSVKKLIALGFEVTIEAGAGIASNIPDELFIAAGARIANDGPMILAEADILLSVNAPLLELIEYLKPGAVLVGMVSPYENATLIAACTQKQISVFAMELMPRISRAQSMDVLSSQSNLAGYRAVIEGMHALHKAAPMMMTAAGTVVPARVLVLGAGVAGLQAIATAKRLGALVSAFDVRAATKEQVESLGAKFIEVPAAETANAETTGGYAREMSADYKAKQATLIHETLAKQDLAITTALIPGKPAPVLITEEMVKGMKPGAVIIDLAVAAGGNCPLSIVDEPVIAHGVTILGFSNLASAVAADATVLYARNLVTFLATLMDKGKFAINMEDALVQATLLTHGGESKKTFPAIS